MGRTTLPGSQSLPQVPADNCFLRHASSTNVTGYFGARTGNRSQHAVAFVRAPGKRSLCLNAKYLQVSRSCLPAGRMPGWVRGSVPRGWTSPQPTRFTRRRVRELNAGGFSSVKCNLLVKRGLCDGGIGFPAKWQGLIQAVGWGAGNGQRTRGRCHRLPERPLCPCPGSGPVLLKRFLHQILWTLPLQGKCVSKSQNQAP